MLIQRFSITNLLLKYIVTIEKKALEIQKSPLPYKKYKDLYRDLQIENIQALSQILNMPIGLEKSSNIFDGKVLPRLSNPNNIFINFRSTNEFIKSYNANNQLQPSNELLQHLNQLLGSRIINEWDLGKFREFGDKVEQQFDTWAIYKEFYPQITLKEHFENIFKWIMNNNDNTHKIIQATVLLYEMIDKAPLKALNQVTAISLYTALLKLYDYNVQNLLPVAQMINFINDDIGTALKISRTHKDITVFLELILYSLSIAIIDLQNRIDNVNNETAIYSFKAKENLNYRQLKALSYIEKKGRIQRSDYSNIMGVSFMTAYRDLKEMEEKGFIQKKGVGKATYYTLTNEIIDQLFEKEKEKDNKVDLPVIGDDVF